MFDIELFKFLFIKSLPEYRPMKEAALGHLGRRMTCRETSLGLDV
jgi:hypothetical protein